MTIYEAIGILIVVYFVATGVAAHLYVLHHGSEQIRKRNMAGQQHERDAEKMLVDMRYPVVR